MSIVRIGGKAPEFYTVLGPHVTDPEVIRKRCNLPITTKESMTWHVLKKRDGKVAAFVGEEPVHVPKKDLEDKEIPVEQRPLKQTKLQAFVVLEAGDDELLNFIGHVVDHFEKSPSPILTASVLNEHAVLFRKARFKTINYKVNWTDLAIIKK